MNQAHRGNCTRPSEETHVIEGIESLWHGRKHPSVILAGGDDCAVFRPSGASEDLLLTADQLVEGQHFLRDRQPPATLGLKALVRSLSDVAAMGGQPVCFLQTVCLPAWACGAWHDEFQRGMRRAAEMAGLERLSLIGGDVAGGTLFVATTTVVGSVERETALRRDGARPGDALYVTGSLGGAGLGLDILLRDRKPDADHPAVLRHCEPVPRVAEGQMLREAQATAAIDLSDGLAIDGNRMADASGLALVIDVSCIPLFPGADPDAAIRSGEEYELLFTIHPGGRIPTGIDATRIGHAEEGEGTWLIADGGRHRLGWEGFSHL